MYDCMFDSKELRSDGIVAEKVSVLTEADFQAIPTERFAACSVAGGGAMGKPLDVKLLLTDGTLYHWNLADWDVAPQEFGTMLRSAGLNILLNLGVGNLLYVRQPKAASLIVMLNDYLEAHRGEPLFPTAVLYHNWVAFLREERMEEGN